MSLDALHRVMSPKQIDAAVNCTARINILHGAVSSGKTVASLLAFLFAVTLAPHNGLIFIIGRTLQTVERNIIDPLQQPFGPFGMVSKYVLHTRGATTATIFGRVVHLVGANDVRAEGRIRGATAALIYVDEATLVPESFFTMCLSRLRVAGARLIATTNPDGPMHWLRQKLLLREEELNLRQWHFDLTDNPSLTRDYIDSLRVEYTGLFFRRFILGEWCLAEGAIYDAWDPARHIVDELPLMAEWVGVGIDHGTVNPFAALLLGLGVDGRLYLASEYRYDSKIRYRQLTDVEYSLNVRAWLAQVPIPGTSPRLHGVVPPWWVLDPSAANFRVQLHQDGVAAKLADNAVLPGVQLVASLIATNRLRVHRSCAGWVNEVTAYSWDPKAAERGEDAPIKVADHSLDAGRYVLNTTQAVWRARLRQPDLTLAA